MGSTKIIHVLKNDDFNEVFDLFKNVEAEEVIFIFPKGSRFAKQGQYFEAIKREANNKECKISVMTADPVIAGYAEQHDIELLQTPEPQKRTNLSELNYDRLSTGDFEDNGNEMEAQLTVSKSSLPRPSLNRIVIKDIIRPESKVERPVRINEERVKPFEVEIKKELQTKNDAAGDITKVWAYREQERAPITARSHTLWGGGIKKPRIPRMFRRTMLFLVGGSVLVLALILYGTLGSAHVTIKPQKQELNFQLKISASTSATSVDASFNRVPGQRFSAKEEESGIFAASGQKEVVQKASGEITIYNKSPLPQRLVATTRFKSPDGLIFRIPETINVPAATGAGSTFKEGAIKSAVYADRPGPEYNIAPTTFTIPGFEGTPKHDDFYSKSDKLMTGGIIGPSKVVMEEDFSKAQEALTSKVKEKILQSLKSQAGGLKILESAAIKLLPPETNAKVGVAAENLQMKISGTADTLAFREIDVMELVKNYVGQKGDLELSEKELTITYSNPQSSADRSTLAFNIQVTGVAFAKIDQNKIAQDIEGMSENSIREYFKNKKEVESARVILSPFWIKSVPKDAEKIKLSVEKE